MERKLPIIIKNNLPLTYRAWKDLENYKWVFGHLLTNANFFVWGYKFI